MRRALRPDGALAIGEPFLAEPLPDEIQMRRNIDAGGLRNLEATAEAFESHGLELTTMIVSSQDDWDHYESQHWRATYAWATTHPDHPDRAELVSQVRDARERYLGWERRHIGWAMLVGRPSLRV